MRKSPGHITWVRALGLTTFKEDPPKLYKIEFSLELVKWFLNGKLLKLMFFPLKFKKKKNKSPVQKNDQAMRKFPGNVLWVRALSLFMCKEDPLKLYKIEFDWNWSNGFSTVNTRK
jgi:hypothetical protein